MNVDEYLMKFLKGTNMMHQRAAENFIKYTILSKFCVKLSILAWFPKQPNTNCLTYRKTR